MDFAKRSAGSSKRRRSADRPHRRSCTPRNLCARCSMMKVIQYRFAAFRRVFGRDPLPNEPLFFSLVGRIAVTADKRQLVVQLSEAARATGVHLGGLLNFLSLTTARL